MRLLIDTHALLWWLSDDPSLSAARPTSGRLFFTSQAFERQSVYNTDMGNRVIHISDADAASDFTSLLDRVRAGDEVVIEHDARPVAVLRPAAPAQSIDQVFAAIAADVPDEDWARVPTDLSKNVDHYLYGTSKVSR